jgi:hypothetical protein
MCSRGAIINRYTMAFQLNEALEAIQAALTNEDADPAIWVSLAEILGHVCVAWHRRRLGPGEVAKESQEEYELKAVSVPNWGGRFRLVEFSAAHPAIAPRLSRRKIDRETVCTYLRAAQVALQTLMGQVESGQFDSCDIASLENEFELILQNLCLAWHLRYLSGAEISSLDPAARKELGWWLPPWQGNLRFVPPDEEVEKAAERS